MEELRSSVSLLVANLESLPVSRGGADFKQRLRRSPLSSSFLDVGEEAEVLSKSDVVLSFTLEASAAGPRVRADPDPHHSKETLFSRLWWWRFRV